MFVHFNTVAEILKYFKAKLSPAYPENEVNNITQILFEHYLGWDKMELRRRENESLSESELLLFHKALKRLAKHEPVQHITENTEFYGLQFKVSGDVLIPRPETEELVDLIIKESKGEETILDIGTGTGCIPISIKYNLPTSKLIALDVSEEALMIAKLNAKLSNVEVEFINSNILLLDSLREINENTIDVIVSNPPYITHSEKELMNKNVLSYEPHLALFIDDSEPLLFYRKISELAYKKLKKGGRLYFEINESFGEPTAKLLKSNGFSDIRIIKDLQNKDRIIAATR